MHAARPPFGTPAEISCGSVESVASPAFGCTEVDILGGHHRGTAAGCPLELPVEVGVCDHLLRRRSTPLSAVRCCVGVSDKREIVTPGESTMDGGS